MPFMEKCVWHLNCVRIPCETRYIQAINWRRTHIIAKQFDSKSTNSYLKSSHNWFTYLCWICSAADDIVTNFMEEWRLHSNWNSVTQVKQKLITWKNYWRSRFTTPNHVFNFMNQKWLALLVRCTPNLRPKIEPKGVAYTKVFSMVLLYDSVFYLLHKYCSFKLKIIEMLKTALKKYSIM